MNLTFEMTPEQLPAPTLYMARKCDGLFTPIHGYT